MKIQTRLLISILPVVFIIVALVVGVSINISTDAVEKQAKDNGILLSKSFSDQLDAKVLQLLNMSKDLSSAIVTAVNIETVLIDTRKRYPDISNLFYTSLDGHVIDMAPYRRSFTDFDFSNYSEFHNAKSLLEPTISDPIVFNGKEFFIIFSPVILDYVADREPEIVGVASLIIPSDYIFKEYENVSYGETGSVLITNRYGKIISFRDETLIDKSISNLPATTDLSNVKDSVINGYSGLGTYYLGSEKKFISFNPVSSAGWTLSIVGSYREFTKYSYKLLIASLVILAVGLLFSLLIIFILVRGTVKPIEEITSIAEGINKGDMSLRSNVQSRSEVGILSKAINGMLDRLTHYNEVLEIEVDERTRELQATNEELESTNEQMEAVNEELSATVEVVDKKNRELEQVNSDMEAMNEELTVTVEELDSKNRELEQVNKEIEAVNEELKVTVEELDNKNREVEAMNEELTTTNEALDVSIKEGEALNEELLTTVEHLNDSNRELEIARSSLWSEMELAQKLQTVLLPEEPKMEGYDISAFMKTNAKVGGDYYDVINVEGRDWFLIGDVSGHGVSAGLIMMMVQTSIHVALSQNPSSEPHKLLSTINRTIHSNIHKLGGNKYMTLTVFACLDGDKFSYAGAHLPVIMYRKDRGEIEVLETPGAWIGLVNDIEDMNENSEFSMNSGDVLLLYTDGISEAVDKSGKAFNQTALAKKFKELVNSDSKTICNSLKDLSNELVLDDDATVMVIKKV